jgi:homoserine kinase type II
MSVYTTIERDELEAFLQHYPLGKLQQYEGISAGIENTNYFVDTEKGRFVLTIFESLGKDELPYFLDLMAHLAEHDVPSAHPEADNNGHYLRELKGKPAALVQRLSGKGVEQPSIKQCAALGKALGHLHVVGQSFTGQRANERGPHWWHETAKAVMPHLSEDEQSLLDNELHFQKQHEHDNLPRGVIHADLFRDNALFDGDQLTGLIDFYYACNDVLLYDVAVTVNDWCTCPDGSLDKERLDALVSAYQQERPFTQDEQQAWPVMMRAGALRFWLSRLQDKYFPREGEITHIKDPDAFKRILINRATA